MAHRVGSIGEFRDWISRIVRNPAVAQDSPKRWFDTEETARAARSARLADPVAVERFLGEVRDNPATNHMTGDQLAEFIAWKLELEGHRRGP